MAVYMKLKIERCYFISKNRRTSKAANLQVLWLNDNLLAERRSLLGFSGACQVLLNPTCPHLFYSGYFLLLL